MFSKGIYGAIAFVRKISLSAYSSAKKEIPFTYVRTKKPQSIFTTGDKIGLEKVPDSAPLLKYKNCKNLETLDDTVRKLISVEYAPGKEKTKLQQRDIMRGVQRHPLDTGSTESKIAAMTTKIRSGQEYMRQFPKNKQSKVVLHNLIHRRTRALKQLRRLDYNRFEWLLEKLQITYQPPKLFTHWETRKGTLRKMTEEDCVRRRKVKIDEYRNKLKSMQADFLKEKRRNVKMG